MSLLALRIGQWFYRCILTFSNAQKPNDVKLWLVYGYITRLDRLIAEDWQCSLAHWFLREGVTSWRLSWRAVDHCRSVHNLGYIRENQIVEKYSRKMHRCDFPGSELLQRALNNGRSQYPSLDFLAPFLVMVPTCRWPSTRVVQQFEIFEGWAFASIEIIHWRNGGNLSRSYLRHLPCVARSNDVS